MVLFLTSIRYYLNLKQRHAGRLFQVVTMHMYDLNLTSGSEKGSTTARASFGIERSFDFREPLA